MDQMKSLLLELDSLKSVYRKSYISDGTRNENSAEHSWHLAMALMALKTQLPCELNLDHAIKLALVHDVCEIGAGDAFVYDKDNLETAKNEGAFLCSLSARHPAFGDEAYQLWLEFESQETLESNWVKVVDKLLPFILNVATEGRTWQEQNVTAKMVRRNNESIYKVAPDIYKWMMGELDKAIINGWLLKA